MKKLWKSRTFWVAVLQGVLGIFIVILSEIPELKAVGGFALAKAFLDIALRLVTEEKVEL